MGQSAIGNWQDYEWWNKPKNNAHESIVGVIQRIDNAQGYKYDQNLHHLRLYSNFAATSLSSSGYSVPSTDARIKMNLIKSVVDSATSRIGTVRPRPLFLTDKGSWSQQKKAKGLNKFVMGLFHHLRQYELGLKVFKDAAIFGLGIQHITTTTDHRIHIERVFPNELIIDDVEAKYGEPRSMFRHKEIGSYQLARLYPEHKAAIESSGFVRQDGYGYGYDQGFHPISWVEAWHLPSGPGANDGRHVICTSGATLVDEPWEQDSFPMAFFRWSERPLGFTGIGLAEELGDIQLEINWILQKIQRLMTLATTQVWAHEGSINKNLLSNEDMAFREYRGQPPIFMPVQSVSPEYFSQLDRLWARGFETAGISQLTATGQKPAGLNSGAALREHQDIQSLRFLSVQQRWESFYLEVARQMIAQAKYIDEEKPGGFSIMAPGDRALESLDFKDIDMDKEKYTIHVYPTSLLPETPAGKLQTIQELGQISPEIQRVMLSQLDFPDVDSAISLINAPLEMADKLIESMLDAGEYRPPEPLMDLDLTINRMTHALIKADVDGAPDDRLELLRRFISEADALRQPPPQAAQELGAPPAGPGGGASAAALGAGGAPLNIAAPLGTPVAA